MKVHTIHWTFEVGGMEQPVLRLVKRKGICRIKVIPISKSFLGSLNCVGQTFTEIKIQKCQFTRSIGRSR